MNESRTSAKRKAKELAKYLRNERPDYAYLKSLFQHLRHELGVEVPKTVKKLPYVPTEDELKRYYDVVWKAKNFQDMMIIKTLLYTGVRVSELIRGSLRKRIAEYVRQGTKGQLTKSILPSNGLKFFVRFKNLRRIARFMQPH